MSFLSPWFLAGLAVLTLPLWLHLLERQNPVRVPFSSLMFFQRRTERSIRHRRLRYLLLLISRLALLAFLALLFARPVIKSTVGASFQPSRNHIIALDTSFSMGYGDRWSRAQTEALAAVGQIRSGDRGQVIGFGPGVQMLGDPTQDAATLRSAIQALKPTASRGSYGELGQSLRTLAENSSLPSVVHVISDFQRSAMPGRFADLSLPATAKLEPVNVSKADDRNWCVESIKGDAHLYQNARPRLEVTVAGFATPAATRRVTLLVNGKQVGAQSAAVPESGRATVVFTDFDVPHGQSRAEVRIDSADALPGDDTRLFSFSKSDPSPILFVHAGRPREVLYYRTALDAAGASIFTLQPATPVEASTLPLEKFAFVVLSDVARLPGTFEQRLKAYVEAGGAVLLVLGPAVALDGNAPLLTSRISDARYTGREGARFQQVGEIDLGHPALRDSRRFSGVKFFRWVRWEAPPNVRVLARLSDGSPLLVEESRGAGRLIVLASALDNLWNDLPVHPLFVPFVTESARYLSGVEELVTQATVDSVLQLQRRRDPRATVEVIDPAGRRALDLKAAVSNPEVILASRGFYEVRRAGNSELVAVNPDRRESDLRPMDDETLALWKSTGEVEAGKAAAAASGTKVAPRDLWRIVLIIVLLAAVIESVLGNLHLGVQREVGSE